MVITVAAMLTLAACSTTRSLLPGQYRLTEAKVKVTNDKKFKTNKVDSYIKQKPGSVDPMLFVYNWSGPEVNNAFDRFFRKIGTPPVIYDPAMVEASVENIAKRLEYLGYYGSTVTPEIRVKGKKAKVNYMVTLGKRYTISGVQYSIPDRGDFPQDFYKDTASVTVRPGDYLSEEALEAESERSAAHFRENGYYGFNKNYYSFEADTLQVPGEAALTMKVQEYTRNETAKSAKPLVKYDFGNVDYYYPKSLKLRSSFIPKRNTLRPGDPYSASAVTKAYSRFSSLGMFSAVNVELVPRADSALVDCRINLTPSRMQGFKIKLEASSNSSGLLGVSPELSYYHKNIFRGGETLNLSFMGNFQFRFSDKVRANEFGVSGGVTFPEFLGLPNRIFTGELPSTEIKASFNYQDRPEYTRYIVSTSYGYLGHFGKFYYQAYPLKVSIIRLTEIDESFFYSLLVNPFMAGSYISHFDLGAGANIYYTTNADLNPKTSYKYVRFQFGIAGNLVSLFNPLLKTDEDGYKLLWDVPYSQYVRGELSLGQTYTFGNNDNQAFAMRFVAGIGYAYGNSKTLPFEQHFYAGGASSMRGWQARGVGPGFSKPEEIFVIPNQTGDMKLEADVEYRFPLFWKLRGAVFAEAGNVWNIQSDQSQEKESEINADKFYESLALDWGAGLRLDLDFILLRVDLGLQLYKPSNDAGSRWLGPKQWFEKNNFAVHFGVGYPF